MPVVVEPPNGSVVTDVVGSAALPLPAEFLGGAALRDKVVTAAEAVRPTFWAEQIAGPVLFWPALDAALTRSDWMLVAAGPATELAVVARRHPAVRAGRTEIAQLPIPGRGQSTAAWDEAVAVLADRTTTSPSSGRP